MENKPSQSKYHDPKGKANMWKQMWLGPCTSNWSIWILRESKGGQRGQSISRTNWFRGAFEKLRLVLGVINVKCKAQLMGLKPVLSFLK